MRKEGDQTRGEETLLFRGGEHGRREERRGEEEREERRGGERRGLLFLISTLAKVYFNFSRSLCLSLTSE